jgi:signal transduction histidine kinase/CheY-like chemotaxis protein
MIEAAEDRTREGRVLVLAPTARDAGLCRSILAEAGIAATTCPDVAAICRELGDGAGAAVLTEEALRPEGFASLSDFLAHQPAWSDFPFIVLTRGGTASDVALRTLELLGNVTLLERPVGVPVLVSSVRTALRARRRQYQIRDHLAESRRLTESLQQSDRHKDEFLAMLAHELRNPLAPIRNGLAILEATGGAGPNAAGVRAMMERQVTHMVRLVDDLLDVSRILRGRIELRPEALDLAEVLARAAETARPAIDAQRHELTIAVEPGFCVEGDAVRLAQVFANLLNNAAKYTAPGGRVAVTARAEGGRVAVSIRDTGEGIPAELLPKVFDLFTQAQRTLDRSQGGLGLGLTLVRRLVAMHGGSVEAASDGPGRGSEFTVRLPLLAPRALDCDAANATRPTAVPNARRILVVDDNVDAADSLATLLRLTGHDVSTAYSGPDALHAARERRPEVVLLDIGLPGMSGYEVAGRLRELPGLERAVVVAVTGYGQDEDRKHSQQAGFDLHLTKPVSLDELRSALNGSHG